MPTRLPTRLGLAALLLATTSTPAAVYQYTVDVAGRPAYLWIPPACPRVRGVIMSLNNLLERNWLEDPLVRQAAADEGLAIVWLGPAPTGSPRGRGPALTADVRPGEGDLLAKMLQDLATESGYSELQFAPFLPMGHSANGQFAWTVPTWNPDRTIAAIPIKTVPLPASLAFTGIPLCYLVGQTTEWPQYRAPDTRPGDRDFFWPNVRDSALRLRAREDNLVGVVTEPGGGHFDWSPRQAQFVALYIRKACDYRLPQDPPADAPPKLLPILPESGWLTDTGGIDPDKFPPAPYKQYQGDPKKAYWFFDEETARAAVAFEGDRKPRERQMLTFIQDGQPLPVATQGFATLKFQPDPASPLASPPGDGLTFKLQGAFLTELPKELIGAGTKLGHSPNGPITFRVVTGPAIQTAPDTFRVHFDRAGPGETWIQEEHPGDDQFRRAVQPGKVALPARLTAGTPQTLTFPPIGNQKAATKTLDLYATADSGLPVDYYIVAGPAEVSGHTLQIQEIPTRAQYPIKITVVAYQYGRTLAPQYQTSPFITQTFLLEK